MIDRISEYVPPLWVPIAGAAMWIFYRVRKYLKNPNHGGRRR